MSPTGAPRLTVAHLSVSFGGVHALRDVDLTVDAGEIVGLIGPNGAGKTTFIDAVTGFVPVTAGRVTLNGRPVERLPANRRARLGLVRTFQSAETFGPLTVADHLRAASFRGGLGALARSVLAPRGSAGADVAPLLREVGLKAVADQFPDDLSYGQRKLVDLARALATSPTVVLLDEPAAGLDSEETAELGLVLRRLQDRGLGIVLVDHDMDLVLEICDRVTVLDFGQCIASAAPAEIRTDPRVIHSYLGAAP